MAFTPAASSARIEASVRQRLVEIRNALGIPNSEQQCAPRSRVKLDPSLWQEADRVLEADEAELKKEFTQQFNDKSLADSPNMSSSDVTTTAEILAIIDRISSNPDNAAFLSRFSKAVFGCYPWGAKGPAMRGAAAMIFFKAAVSEDGVSEPHTLATYDHPMYLFTGYQLEHRKVGPRRERVWVQEQKSLAGQPSTPSEEPRLCVALSGGGVRSAAFSLGVLQGLSELERRDKSALGLTRLDDVDIISAVSGGSYALAWFLSEKEPLGNPSRDAFARNDSLGSWLTTPLEGAAGAFLSTATVMLRKIARIGPRTPIPDPTLAHYYYARLLTASFDLRDRPLADFKPNANLPFPIFIATGRLGDEGPCGAATPQSPLLGEAARIERSVVELTPLAGGSAGLGFSSRLPRDLSLPMVVATAGAALDDPHSDYCGTLRGLGVTLGTRVGLWKPDRQDERIHSAVPPEKSDGPLLLSDGGFSDNLGVYPLLRRSCSAILIADASYDPDLLFLDFQRLKTVLAAKNIKLSSTLSERAKEQSVLCEAGSNPPCFMKPSPAALAAPFAATRQGKATFDGVIEIPGETQSRRIPFSYVKLAVDEDHPKAYPSAVEAMIGKGDGKKSRFPHIPTSRQKLSEKEFAAIRLLGCHLVEKLYADSYDVPADSPCKGQMPSD